MCGIAGLITRGADTATALLKAEKAQQHRGPDAQTRKLYTVAGWEVGFAHQRLAIIDLSDAGTQPMTLDVGKDVIIYNGEVYNYRELRQELQKEGCLFRTTTDTEVVLTALRQWGIEKALNRFNGMWAFAWLAPDRERLYLARDRSAIKPLYYHQVEGKFYFASEIKTILAMTGKRFSLNHEVVHAFISQSLLDASDETMFKGICSLPAGYYAELDLGRASITADLKPYSSLPSRPHIPTSDASLIEQVRETFFDAVKLRLRSDVPVGVLLSGGIDSSAIACAMHKLLGNSVALNLLSAVSNDSRFDESLHISRVEKHLGRDAHRISVDITPQEAIRTLQEVTRINDEPVGSFASVAHYELMKAARNLGITVVLSGQGADELMCGYKKYLGFYIQILLRQGKFAKAAATLATFYRQKTILSQFSFQEAKRYLPRFLKRNEFDIRGPNLLHYPATALGLAESKTVQERQARDISRLSVPQLTHYEDRMSMAWSREVRLPFLDHRFIELMLPLAPEHKLKSGWTKYIFRKAMEPYMPKEITWRKDKQGFINPQSEWLRYGLRSQILAHFEEESLIFKKGLIERKPLLEQYNAYIAQTNERGTVWYRDVFKPLALEVWLRQYETNIA